MAKVSKRIGNRRLLKLADMLEADAKNKKGIKFDLRIVGQVSDINQYYNTSKKFEPKLDCGTSACAMGLAAISGKFKRAGLSYRVRNYSINMTVNNRIVYFDDAAMRIFGITWKEANYLFNSYY